MTVFFSNHVADLFHLLESIKVILWKWFLGRSKNGSCPLYKWCVNSLECIMRN